MLTIEEFLRLSNRLREYYGKQIKDRFSEYTFSPNEISILILLQNNTSITTSTQLRVVLGVSKALVSFLYSVNFTFSQVWHKRD